jgi:hypothetical protein
LQLYGTSLPEQEDVWNFRPLNFCWTECTCIPWHAQYGRWNFLRDLRRVHKVLTIFLFICIWGAKSAFVQLIKYILTKKQPSLHSWTSNLFFRWPHCAQPRSHRLLTWLPPSVWKLLFLVYFDLGYKVCLCYAVCC